MLNEKVKKGSQVGKKRVQLDLFQTRGSQSGFFSTPNSWHYTHTHTCTCPSGRDRYTSTLIQAWWENPLNKPTPQSANVPINKHQRTGVNAAAYRAANQCSRKDIPVPISCCVIRFTLLVSVQQFNTLAPPEPSLSTTPHPVQLFLLLLFVCLYISSVLVSLTPHTNIHTPIHSLTTHLT